MTAVADEAREPPTTSEALKAPPRHEAKPGAVQNGLIGAAVRVILDSNMESKPAITYDFNGVKHIQRGHNFRAITGDEFTVFEMLKALETQGAWVEVRELCEAQIQKTPEWLTPYLCAGVAHANLGNVEEAIIRLEHVELMASGNPDYSAATRILKELRKERARSSANRN
jgi:hypothetical protein